MREVLLRQSLTKIGRVKNKALLPLPGSWYVLILILSGNAKSLTMLFVGLYSLRQARALVRQSTLPVQTIDIRVWRRRLSMVVRPRLHLRLGLFLHKLAIVGQRRTEVFVLVLRLVLLLACYRLMSNLINLCSQGCACKPKHFEFFSGYLL